MAKNWASNSGILVVVLSHLGTLACSTEDEGASGTSQTSGGELNCSEMDVETCQEAGCHIGNFGGELECFNPPSHEGGLSCTDIGCADTLRIGYADLLGSGSYEVQVFADGVSGSCTFDRTESSTFNLECMGDAGVSPSIDYLVFSGAPVEVVVEIRDAEGTPIAEGEFTPSYQESAPNGVECGPVCRQSTVTLSQPSGVGGAGGGRM